MRKKLIAVIIMISLFLSACSGQTMEEQPADSTEVAWTLQEAPLTEWNDAWTEEVFSEEIVWLNNAYVWQLVQNEQTKENTYLCGSAIDGGFCIWSMEEKKLLFEVDEVTMNFTDRVAFADKTEGFLCNGEGIWQFSLTSGKLEQVLSFREQGYVVDKINGAVVKEDATLVMLVEVEGENVLLEKVEDKSIEDKVELEFAVSYASPFLKKAVVDFNKRSDEYYVVLRTPKDGENGIDFGIRIQAEVTGGDGPDMLKGSLLDLKHGTQKGFFMDLTDEFAEQKEQMLENVQAADVVDGKSYAIPYAFNVQTLVVNSELVGNAASWNMEEMMQCVQDSGAKSAVGCMDGATLFYIMGAYGSSNRELVDLKKRESYLDSPEAVSLLEFSKQYADAGTYEDLGIRLANEEALADFVFLTGLDRAISYEAVFQGKAAYIGFPAGEGENGNILNVESIAVNQACEAPEGAVAFIQFLLTQETQDNLAKNSLGMETIGFPVYKDAFENVFTYAERKAENDEEGLEAEYCGYSYAVKPLNAESLGKIRTLLESAETDESRDGLSDIIMQETAAYFNGDKSAQEVCEVMQNRTQLYLKEME